MARQHPMLDCASHPRCQRSSTRAGVPRQTWIEEHFAAHNPVDGMPERSRLPRTTFARRFRKATGYAPMEYVHTIRVERAKLLLEQTTDPVEHIGGRVGYEDIASFRRLFKRKKSLTPTEYRRSFGDLCFIKLKDAVTPSTAYRLTDTIGEAGADDAPSRGIQ